MIHIFILLTDLLTKTPQLSNPFLEFQEETLANLRPRREFSLCYRSSIILLDLARETTLGRSADDEMVMPETEDLNKNAVRFIS